MRRLLSGLQVALATFFLLVPFASALAQQGICAEVRIEIPQRLSLERQGFIATMRINNGADTQPLTNVGINVRFQDANGQAVRASSDPNDTEATFFLRVDSETDIAGGITGDGQIGPRSTAVIRWLIIPAAGAGGVTPIGENYGVGATLTYQLGTEPRTIEVAPEIITVRPQPRLALDYFLPGDVYGDDPMTPAVEPVIPFTLGVRVRNVGAGRSASTRIDTAQPRIVDNRQGLAVAFQIAQGLVDDVPVERTLLLDFGEVAAGAAKTGRWRMTSSLTGQFVDFSASYTHADTLGGALTSLIDSVTTHTLVGDVLVDAPNRDGVRDFLARSGDVLRVFESSGATTPVIDRTAEAQLVAPSDGDWSLTLPSTTGATFARLSDPSNGSVAFIDVRRGDGSLLPAGNVWLSREGFGSETRYYVNLFDARGGGSFTLRRSAAAPTASIAGFVYRDLNNNGIRESGEQGLPGVTVLLDRSAGGPPVSRSATTDADGLFRFETLPAGTWRMAVGPAEGLENGQHRAGSAGGQVEADAIAGITLSEGTQGAGYLFAKRSAQAAAADLAVSLESDADSVPEGSEFEVVVRLANAGPSAADAVTQLIVPSGLEIRSVAPAAGSFDVAQRRWTVAALAANTETALVIAFRAMGQGPALLRSSATGAIADPNPTNNVAERTFTITAPATGLRATQALANAPRVLVMATCRNAGIIDSACSASRSTAIASWLDQAGVEHRVVSSTAGYREGLRSGRYNVLWLNGGADRIEGRLLDETIEFVRSGGGLLIDGPADSRTNAIVAALGSTHVDELPAPAATAIRVLGGVGAVNTLAKQEAVLPIAPGAQLLSATTAVPRAVFDGRAEAAVLAGTLGDGRSLHIGFDLVESLRTAGAQGPAWRAVVLGWLDELAPTDSPTLTGAGRVRLTHRIVNDGPAAAEVALTVDVPPGFELAGSDLGAPVVNGEARRWTATVPANGERTFWTELRAPAITGTVVVNSRIDQLGAGGPDLIGQYQQALTVCAATERFNDVIAALQALNLSGDDASARDASIAALQRARTRLGEESFDLAINELVQAQTLLRQVTVPELVPIRLEIARLMRETGARWQRLAPVCATGVPPRPVHPAVFYPFASNERLEIRSGRRGAADWEWGVGANTQQAGRFAQIANIDWIDKREFTWTLEYLADGRAVLVVRDGTTIRGTATFTPPAGSAGMRSGTGLRLYVRAVADTAPATITGRITEINGAATSVEFTAANSAPGSESTAVLEFPPMAAGLSARGSVRLTFSGLAPPNGSRLSMTVTAGDVACRAEFAP